MMFFKLLRFDLWHGLVRNKPLLLAAAFLPLLFCFDANRTLLPTDARLAFADYFAYMFGGMKASFVYFSVPLVWTIRMLALPLATLIYPYRDMHGIGQQMLVLSRSRRAWWASKCAWNVGCSLAYNAFAFGVAALFSVLFGAGLRSEIGAAFLRNAFGLGSERQLLAGPYALTLEMALAPVLISAALSLFQMCLSMYIKPLFSFLAMMVLLVSSAYVFSPWIPGNYAMVVRSSAVIGNGVDMRLGIAFALCIMLLSAAAGYAKFRRWDGAANSF